jgi:hypothetical protein
MNDCDLTAEAQDSVSLFQQAYGVFDMQNVE